MWHRSPPLTALRAYAALVESGSVQAAAEQLSLTQGAVGHQIRALEEFLGVELVLRQGRKLMLTDAGRIYGYQVRQALNDIMEATHRVRRPQRADAEGVLRVSVLPSFLSGWLLARVPKFCRKHPRIRMHWHASMQMVPLDQGLVDCAIRFGHGNWPDALIRPLMKDQLIAVASPEFMRMNPALSLSRLLKHPLLHASESWSAYLSAMTQETDLRVPQPFMVFTDSTQMLQAAQQGLGVALTRRSIADDALAQNKLVLAWPHACEHASAYYALSPQAASDNPMREAFLTWLQQECVRYQAQITQAR